MFPPKHLLFVCYLLTVTHTTLSHSHDHGHSHEEPPSFKYSREANVKQQQAVPRTSEPGSARQSIPGKHKVVFDTAQELWLYAIGSTILISAAPFFILFLVPLDNTDTESPLLKILLAFASGGLLGDAFLHLIPHANMAIEEMNHHHSHSHSHSHSHDGQEHVHDMSVGLWVLAGIIAFLIVEKSVRILKGGHSHSHQKSTSNSTSSEPIVEKNAKENTVKNEKVSEESSKENTPGDGSNQVKEEEEVKDIKVAGYLNLAADFSHNFTDGLAIGSSYLAGNTIGIVTTITILLHEVPHEIGDFAILLQSGVSRRKAMLLQLTTAIGALAGTVLSLLVQNESELAAATWILPFTAGGFIYIALVSVIPELLDEAHPSFKQTIFQLTALFIGLAMMVLIAEYE